jgi:hypothetical protein
MNHRTPNYGCRLGVLFDGEALSPYYLLRLFSQNVKIATIHPDIMGAIMLTNIKLMISPPSAENTAGS